MSGPADHNKRPASRGASCDVVVVAAGAGERLGHGIPKALVRLGHETILSHALRSLAAADLHDPVVVVADGHVDDFRSVTDPLGVTRVVTGGATRHDSVRAGVRSTRDGVERIAIHDAARPLMPSDVIAAVVDAVIGDIVAAAPALPVADTLKQTVDGVVTTVDRSGLEAVQTPQVFRADVLHSLLDSESADVTDELALVEQAIAAGAAKGRIALVRGSLRGTKITRDDDLELVRDLVRVDTGREPRSTA